MAKMTLPPTPPPVTPAVTAPRRRGRPPKAAVATPPATTTDEPAPAPVTLSKATQHLVDGVRESFMSYRGQFVALIESRAKLAPRFIKAYNAYKAETNRPFASFVRLFDSSVPMDSDGYRAHPTYRAADYLARLVREQAMEEEAVEAGIGTGTGADAPATPQEAIARLIAAILPLIALEHHDRLWSLLTEELHWTEQRVTRLKEQVGAVRPLAYVAAAKGQPRPVLFLAHTRKSSAA